MNKFRYSSACVALSLALTGCVTEYAVTTPDIVGTTHPFASEAIYFIMTDRFVDGDPTNNYETQGGDYPTWQRPLEGPDGKMAYVGYMGGDFQGVLNNADYIRQLGFTAVWMTPVYDNPDQAFAGGEPIAYGGAFKDGGKTGYHGYWPVNYYREDEHLVSDGLDFRALAQALKTKHGLKVVFDIVANHGAPSFSMPTPQESFAKLYDREGNLVADHQNLPPEQLSPETNALHRFFQTQPDIAQLSNLDETQHEVRDYLINSYLHWIAQGADAFRIDTIKHVSHPFWYEMSQRIRQQYPDFFMFGESFDYSANNIAQHTLAKNGAISVLDFPMQETMVKVFGEAGESYQSLQKVLHLSHGPYANPYELTTFYDNHDMPRMQASDAGFIDAHHWLFTARGIPVVYQGSEIGFMRGAAEHAGNRNYLGQALLNDAPGHPIYQALQKIATVRQNTPALQRGIQLDIQYTENTASFYRVMQYGQISQVALVLLNKGDSPASFSVDQWIMAGQWQEKLSEQSITTSVGDTITTVVPAHGAQVWVRNGDINDPAMLDAIRYQLATR